MPKNQSKISFHRSISKLPFLGFYAVCRSIVLKALRHLESIPVKPPYSFKSRFQVEIVLVGRARVASICKVYGQRRNVTDILSFRHPDTIEGSSGSLVICPEVVKHKWSSSIQDHGLKSVYRRLLVHGFVHLMGFDHKNSSKERQMLRVEKFYAHLGLFNIKLLKNEY